MHKNIQEIFEKEMDRRQFLGYIGAAFLATIGVSGILKALMNHDGNVSSGRSLFSRVSDGYGATPYGGAAEAVSSKKLH